jgi:glycine cleavage system H protein
MNTPQGLFYTKTHEWAKKESGKNIKVGITDHAQHEITDIVHVELPGIGKEVSQGQPCAVIESVKSAFDIYSPVSGKVVAVNDKLSSSPELVNQSAYEEGFLFVIEASNPDELKNLMDAKGYEESLK